MKRFIGLLLTLVASIFTKSHADNSNPRTAALDPSPAITSQTLFKLNVAGRLLLSANNDSNPHNNCLFGTSSCHCQTQTGYSSSPNLLYISSFQVCKLLKCVANCVQCMDNQQCGRCKSEEYTKHGSKCVRTRGDKENNTCKVGMVRLGGKCVVQLRHCRGLSREKNSGVVICTECDVGYKLESHKCILGSEDSQNSLLKKLSNSRVVDNCQVNLGSSACIKCSLGYYLYKNRCVRCAVDNHLNSFSKAKDATIKSENILQISASVEKQMESEFEGSVVACQKISSNPLIPLKVTRCKTGLSFNRQKNVCETKTQTESRPEQCKIGQFYNQTGFSCESCLPNCRMCAAGTYCNECEKGYTKDNTKHCVLECNTDGNIRSRREEYLDQESKCQECTGCLSCQRFGKEMCSGCGKCKRECKIAVTRLSHNSYMLDLKDVVMVMAAVAADNKELQISEIGGEHGKKWLIRIPETYYQPGNNSSSTDTKTNSSSHSSTQATAVNSKNIKYYKNKHPNPKSEFILSLNLAKASTADCHYKNPLLKFVLTNNDFKRNNDEIWVHTKLRIARNFFDFICVFAPIFSSKLMFLLDFLIVSQIFDYGVAYENNRQSLTGFLRSLLVARKSGDIDRSTALGLFLKESERKYYLSAFESSVLRLVSDSSLKLYIIGVMIPIIVFIWLTKICFGHLMPVFFQIEAYKVLKEEGVDADIIKTYLKSVSNLKAFTFWLNKPRLRVSVGKCLLWLKERHHRVHSVLLVGLSVFFSEVVVKLTILVSRFPRVFLVSSHFLCLAIGLLYGYLFLSVFSQSSSISKSRAATVRNLRNLKLYKNALLNSVKVGALTFGILTFHRFQPVYNFVLFGLMILFILIKILLISESENLVLYLLTDICLLCYFLFVFYLDKVQNPDSFSILFDCCFVTLHVSVVISVIGNWLVDYLRNDKLESEKGKENCSQETENDDQIKSGIMENRSREA